MRNESFFIIFVCFLGIQMLAAEQNVAFDAVVQKDIPSLRKILQKNTQVTQINNDGQTILHVAVLSNNAQMVNIILKSGLVNINQLDKYGKTAMDYAVEYAYNKMIRKLYKYKAKVTSQDNALYAKKVIARPFKILFFLSLPILLIAFCTNMLSLSVAGNGGLLGFGCAIFFFYPLAGVLLIPGSIGWATRSSHSLLLSTVV